MNFCLDCGRSDCVHLSKANYLTPRELSLVKLIGRGATNKQIAKTCGIREGSTKAMVCLLCTKLSIPRTGNVRVQLALWAHRQKGLMDDPTPIMKANPQRQVRSTAAQPSNR